MVTVWFVFPIVVCWRKSQSGGWKQAWLVIAAMTWVTAGRDSQTGIATAARNMVKPLYSLIPIRETPDDVRHCAFVYESHDNIHLPTPVHSPASWEVILVSLHTLVP